SNTPEPRRKDGRMNSDKPKVLHKLAGLPLLNYVLEAVNSLDFHEAYVIVGHKSDVVMKKFKHLDLNFIEQKEQLGTGHAVMQAETVLKDKDSAILVLNGDMPFIKSSTLKDLIACHQKKRASATVLTAEVDDPTGYGRIIRDPHRDLEKIVEQKDGSLGELEVKEINTGTYCFENRDLIEALNRIRPENSQHEYYLTDVVGILRKKGKRVCALCVKEAYEAMGINTKEQLEEAEKRIKAEKKKGSVI
ncbi:MAG: sugar phosphate nucleotidyltransferase, partial [Candidatus Margulisiibacteriota bacterium]